MSTKRESNRDKRKKEIMQILQTIPLGDLLKEFVEMGDINNIHARRNQQFQVRHPLIVEELNRRWDIMVETNEYVADLQEKLEAPEEETEKKPKKK